MLEKFVVENYMNFRGSLELDLTADPSYTYNTAAAKDNILTTSILLGRSGSGKSNLGKALFDIVETQKKTTPSEAPRAEEEDQDAEDLSSFSYHFRDNQRTYKYTYKKNRENDILEESLFVDQEALFDYKDHRLSALSYMTNNPIQAGYSPVQYISNFIQRILHITPNRCSGPAVEGIDPETWIVQEHQEDNLSSFLKQISGQSLNLTAVRDPLTKEDDLCIILGKKTLPYKETASKGTIALTNIFFTLNILPDPSLLFLDNIDADLDQETTEELFRCLSTLKETQLIWSTHKTSLVSNSLLRPDCYFFLQEGQLRRFSELTTRELREGHNLEKMLRQGEFGF